MVIATGEEVEDMGSCWSKSAYLQLFRMDKSIKVIMFSIIILVNTITTTEDTGSLLRV